ncbi:MAG: hypothetical protein LBJ18_02275 [Rickettsiales bacterium]|nr:hypothetical protein [Rickettsiales bacterium]
MKNIFFAIVGICFCFASHANDCRNDPVRHKKVSCDDSCAEKGWKGGEGARSYCDFPKITTCRDGGFFEDDYWRSCGEMLCDGYSYHQYNPDTATPKPLWDTNKNDFYSACWYWQCKSGSVWNIDTSTNNWTKECITNSDCTNKGDGTTYAPSGGKCDKINWCTDVPTPHILLDRKKYSDFTMEPFYITGATPSGCQSFKCKQPTGFSDSNPDVCMDSSAIMCLKVQRGVLGGRYLNPTTKLCESCAATNPVLSSGTGCGASNMTVAAVMGICKESLINDYNVVGTVKDSAGATLDSLVKAEKNGDNVIMSFRACNIVECKKNKVCCNERYKNDVQELAKCPS